MKIVFVVLLLVLSLLAVTATAGLSEDAQNAPTPLLLPAEKHFQNLKQLTFGGENAEAYFSSDGTHLIFQATRDGRGCDQIYTMNVDGSNVKMISNGDGRTTCSYFFPGGR